MTKRQTQSRTPGCEVAHIGREDKEQPRYRYCCWNHKVFPEKKFFFFIIPSIFMFKEGVQKISIEVPALGSLTPACTETARGQRTGGK